MDLALNNLQSLICHKPKQANKATTPGQCRPGNNSNEEVLHISQNSRIGALPSNSLMTYPGHFLALTPLQRCSLCIL